MKRSIFLSLMLFVGFSTKSQILYTDVEPDLILYTPENSSVKKTIDINQNGIPDFRLKASRFQCEVNPNCWNTYNGITALSMNEILDRPDGYPANDMCIVPILQEDTINANGYWTYWGTQLNSYFMMPYTYCLQPSDYQIYGIRLVIGNHWWTR